MQIALPYRLLIGLWAASFATVCSVASRWQERMTVRPFGRDILYAQEADDGGGAQSKTFQRLRRTPQAATAEYGFINFNQDFLTMRFSVPRAAYEAYLSDWGYRDADLASLKSWNEAARQAAFKDASRLHKSQAQFDQDIAALKVQHDKKVNEYMAGKKFRFVNGNEVEVDMPKVVRDNQPLVKSMAAAFDQVAESRHYESGNIIGAVASMIQTSIIYKIPPPLVNGVHTGGFWPPLQTLLGGWGDCDTKTGALASILANWSQMRMVGLALPEHYLLGILRIPNKGDLFIEYQGLQYILVEPAGPAWLTPGVVGEHTQNLLEASQGYRIEPFF
ncbi:MAG: hypothetical protein HY077_09630 [Elusimicrobia bacterium]|nr:hypothetical protein [Elusimicrobiota bacterium]